MGLVDSFVLNWYEERCFIWIISSDSAEKYQNLVEFDD